MSRADWLESRRLGIGASDVAAVLGLGAYGSPVSVWASKVGEVDDSPPSGPAAMGLDLEPYIIIEASRRLGVQISGSQELAICDDCELLRSTLDGLIESEDGRIPVECKFITRDSFTWGDDPALDWDALADWLEDSSKPFPVSTRAESAYVQLNAQMLCTGAPYGYLVAVMGARAGYLLRIGEKLNAREFRLLKVPADTKLQEAIKKAIPVFWARHVETKTAPPDIEARDLEAIKRHLRSSRAGEATEAPQLAKHARALATARAEIKRITTEAKTHEATIRAELKEAELAFCGPWTITAKTNARGARPIRLKEES